MVGKADTAEGSGTGHLVLRDHLAVDRTILANERTFLAYLRTALSFLAGGGAVIVFFEDDAALSAVGYLSVVLALVCFAIGLYKYMSMKRHIAEEERRESEAAKGLREHLRKMRGAKGEEVNK